MFIYNPIVCRRLLAIATGVCIGPAAKFAIELIRTSEGFDGFALSGSVLILLCCLGYYATWLVWKGRIPLGFTMIKLPDSATWSGPNVIPRGDRIVSVVASFVLVAYGIDALVKGDLYIPSSHGRGGHVYGLEAMYLCASMFCCAIHLMSKVIDHYEKRNNELLYAQVAMISAWFGWVFVASTFIPKWFLLMFLD